MNTNTASTNMTSRVLSYLRNRALFPKIRVAILILAMLYMLPLGYRIFFVLPHEVDVNKARQEAKLVTAQAMMKCLTVKDFWQIVKRTDSEGYAQLVEALAKEGALSPDQAHSMVDDNKVRGDSDRLRIVSLPTSQDSYYKISSDTLDEKVSGK